MSLAKIEQIKGRATVLRGDDIDTDRIIPARFLKCVTFDDLVPGLFADDRALVAEGTVHPLDDSRFEGSNILIVGKNFGCGSSREHAPQAIARSGFEAVIGHSFAEIFFGNAAGIGLPCVKLEAGSLEALCQFVEREPSAKISVDLSALEVRAQKDGEEQSWSCELVEGNRQAFLQGKWDMVATLLEAEEELNETERRLGLLPSG